jgi:hypothetical protein
VTEKLVPSVGPRHRKTNRWWFKMAAFSFLLKLVLLVGFILTIKYAAEAGRADEANQGEGAPTPEVGGDRDSSRP